MTTPTVILQYLSPVVLIFCLKYGEVTSAPSEMDQKKDMFYFKGRETHTEPAVISREQSTDTIRNNGIGWKMHFEPQTYSKVQAANTAAFLFNVLNKKVQQKQIVREFPSSNVVVQSFRKSGYWSNHQRNEQVLHPVQFLKNFNQGKTIGAQAIGMIECNTSHMCSRCLDLQLAYSFCKYLFLRKIHLRNATSSYTIKKVLHRKLLSSDRDMEPDVLNVTQGEAATRYSFRNPSTPLNESEFSALVEALERKLSKDPVWALFSVVGLLVVMILVSKACGMKSINRHHEVNLDIQDDYHRDFVYDVVRRRRRYLPNRLFRLQRKLRKAFRKKKSVKLKEASIPQPISDNSDEEKLIYSRINDF